MSLMFWFKERFMDNKPFISITGRITCYGYPADSTPDSNSRNAIGAWDNKLIDGASLAISPDIEDAFRQAGIHPKDRVKIKLSSGEILYLVWADRTAKTYNGYPLRGRFDLYCAKTPSKLVDSYVVGFSQN